jgi:hypothetical protein
MYWRDTSYPKSVYRNSTGLSGDARYSNISALNRAPASHIRTQWTSLPKDIFGDLNSGQSPAGLLIELPWSDGHRLAIGCSVTAAWHESLVRSVRSKSYSAWSIVLSIYDYGNYGDSPDAPLSNKPVELDETWLNLLTVPSPHTENGSVGLNLLEKLYTETGVAGIIKDYRNRPQPQPQTISPPSTDPCPSNMMDSSMTDTQLWNEVTCNKGDKRYFIEMTLASFIVDGLSRFGSHRAYTMSPDLRDWKLQTLHTFNSSRLLSHLPTSAQLPSEFPTAWIEVFVNGYAYYPSSKSDYLALAVVCLYMLIASSHVIAILSLPEHRITSSTWETVTELLVLCQNSPPPTTDKLNNASSGILQRSTYGTLVKVRVNRSEGTARQAGLECRSGHKSYGYGGQVRLLVDGDTEHVAKSAELVSSITDPLPAGSCSDEDSQSEIFDMDMLVPVESESSESGLRQRALVGQGALEKVRPGFVYS